MHDDTSKVRIYKGFKIEPWSDGFRISPGSLITIASFIVKNDGLVTGFAFAVGMLSRMADLQLTDEKLLQEANKIIDRYTDNQQLKHLEEYTFEYHTSNFLTVHDPKWWIKSNN